MNTFIQKTIYTALPVLFVFISNAQVNLSLEQCRELALQRSEDIRIAGKIMEKADAEKSAARSYYFPSVSGNGNRALSGRQN
jgi:outer membrane protein TolC